MKTHRTLTPETLQDTHYRQMVNSVSDYAIAFLDLDGQVISWNAGARQLHGYEADEVVGQNFSIFYPPELKEKRLPEQQLAVAMESGKCEDEGWRVRQNGTRFWVNVIISHLADEDGVFIGFTLITRDLSERRKQEEQLRSSEERFRLLVEQVQDYAIFMIDPGGYIVSWNLGAEKNKGYTANEIIGKHFSVFYPPEVQLKGWPDEELRLARRDGRFEDEGWRVRKDGTRFWASVVITALSDATGVHRGFAKVTRDLTERRRVYALEDEGRRITTFLAMLGHELRNPLAPIANAVALLDREAEPTKIVRSSREIIGRQLKQLTRLVNDLLDVSRITSGRIHLESGVVRLHDVVRDAVEVVRPIADQLGHKIEVIGLESDPWVQGDGARLVQVVSNLLHNAAKFTPKGGQISIRLSVKQSLAEILVKDNGPGVLPRDLQSIFDLFVQGEQDSARSLGGLGLGLSLVQQLVALHGGSVSAFSTGRLGDGAEFLVQLPAVRPPRLIEKQVSRTSGGLATVLVVDDNQDSADTLALLLESLGYETFVVYRGSDAIEAVKARSFAAVLLDLGLPDVGGIEIAETIRKELQYPPPLIAVTGYGQESDRASTSAAGFLAHLTKPVEIESLRGLLDSVQAAQRGDSARKPGSQ